MHAPNREWRTELVRIFYLNRSTPSGYTYNQRQLDNDGPDKCDRELIKQ